MKEILPLITELKNQGVYLSLDDAGVNLRLTGDVKNLSNEIKQKLRDNKTELLSFLTDRQFTRKRIEPVQLQESYPISDAQRRLWILSRFEEGSIAYNMPQDIFLDHEIDIPSFKKAVMTTIERHEILRTVFREERSVKAEVEVRQHILKAEELGFKIEILDLRAEENPVESARAYISQDSLLAFDLENGPIIRAALLQVEDSGYIFYYNMHHIIGDGWSMNVLIEDVLNFYDSFVQNRESSLPDLRIQYKDYSIWQLDQLNQPGFLNHQNYWLKQLGGKLPTFNLPGAKKRPDVKTHNGKTLVTYLDRALTKKIHHYSTGNQGTLFMTLVTLLKATLFRYSGMEDLIVGTPIAGRSNRELENQIGFFVNTLALRTSITGGETTTGLFQHVKKTILEAYDHQDYPFDRLVDKLEINRQTGRNAIFDILVVLQNTSDKDEVASSSKDLESVEEIEEGTCIFDIKFEFQEEAGQLRFLAEYNTDIYPQEVIEQFMYGFKLLALNALSDPNKSVDDLQFISAKEEEELISVFKEAQINYPRNKSIVDLFEEQVEHNGERTALVFQGNDLTYRQLNEQANQIAHFLTNDVEVAKEDKIGLVLAPGFDMIASILGVLKAGGTYVPLDFSMPEERLSFMLEDAEVKCLIVGKKQLELSNRLLWATDSVKSYLCIDSDDLQKEVEQSENAMMSQELWDHVGEQSYDLITGGGWLSSYTGLPIPEGEMKEYAENVRLKLVEHLNPQSRILEIGCSSGITLRSLAPDVAFYYGTDLSPVILEKTKKMVENEGLQNVKLKQLVAHQVGELDENEFDLIIINSVIQNFHGHNYLKKVIESCVGLLKNKGKIFVGDVMDINRKKNLIEDLEQFKKDNEGKGFTTKTDFSADLFVARNFFHDLKVDMEEIVDVSVSEKIKTIDNELTKFRYDVFLNVNKSSKEARSNKKYKYQFGRDRISNNSKKNVGKDISPKQLAYVIYTSGTTGKPKGVLIEHRNVVRLLTNERSLFDFTHDDVWTLFHSYAFDVSVWEMYGALFFGGKLILLPKDLIQDPSSYLNVLEEHAVTIVNQTPSAFYSLSKELTKRKRDLSARKVIFAGEALTVSRLKDWKSAYPECKLINMYGITEVTVHTTYKEITQSDIDLGISNIGVAIPTSTCVVLDQNRKLLPKGVRGELYVGGEGVARGYLSREALTRERFIPNPYLEGDVLYKSGDEVVLNASGDFEYYGRIDNQVKIRGYRIELGEIEHALLKKPELEQVIVLTKENHENEKELVAYFTAKNELNILSIREELKSILPAYMIPSHFLQVEEMPLTANGKIDKRSLPDPEGFISNTGVEYLPPSNDLEKELVKIWEHVLQRQSIGIKDDFFALGGHSIKAVRLSNEYEKTLGVKLSLEILFTHKNIAAQSRLIREAQKEDFVQIAELDQQESYAISDAQRRIWILSQYDKNSAAYNIPGDVFLNHNVDIESFKKAVKSVVDRHEILRTVFETDANGEPRQRIRTPSETNFEIAYHDFLEDSDPKTKAEEYITEDSFRPFDLENGPLLRATLLKVEKDGYVFYYNMHHIISDGWSMDVLSREVLAFYEKYKAGNDASFSPLRIQYKEYAAWQLDQLKGEAYTDYKSFWMNELSGELPVLDLLSTKKRPSIKTNNGRALRGYLNTDLMGRLKSYSMESGGSHFMSVLAILNVLFHRYTSQEDIIVGTPVSGRDHKDLEDQIGFYVNTLALRNSVNPVESFDAFFQQVKSKVLKAYDHQMYSFDRLVDDLKVRKDPSRNPVFDVSLTYHNTSESTELTDSEKESVDGIEDNGQTKVKFDMELHFRERGNFLSVDLLYNEDVYDVELMTNLLKHFKQLTKALLLAPSDKLANINYLSESEIEVLRKGSTELVSYPQHENVVSLFESQVDVTPDHTAIVFPSDHGEKQMTYAELDAHSNQFANYLKSKYEIEANDLIGIKLERSQWIPAVILGILKSGGAYVPIDPSSPDQRVAFIEEDTGCKLLLDQKELDAFIAVQSTLSSERPSNTINPTDLAYIIYTSGTTGTPKGVKIDHHNVVRLFKTDPSLFEFTSTDVWTMFHSYAFDFSVWEMYGALLFGGKLIVVPQRIAQDTSAYLQLMEKHGVTILNQTPSAFYGLSKMAVEKKTELNVRTVIFGGEALSPGRLSEWNKQYPSCELINMYGITEGTVHTTFKRIDQSEIEQNMSNIGTAIPTVKCLVLDQYMNLLPTGVGGELYIGGEGVAQGYLNREELTNQRFVENPYDTSERLYRTGDKVRLLPNGDLEYLGRMDDQVKIRGYRIELGEIEHALQQHDSITDTVVIARPNEEETNELVAYMVSRQEETVADLRSFLSQQLPDYMLPSYYVQLDELPLNNNGKVDKKALPNPQGLSIKTGVDFVPPENPLEEKIIRIISYIADRPDDSISTLDNFFDLGINSLGIIRLCDAINKEEQLDLQVVSLFEYPSTKALATYVLTRGEQDEIRPLKNDISDDMDEMIDLM
ncbi:MAG: amino acid adenylation domain-containing protein [Crocinitomicaceae bacterium]